MNTLKFGFRYFKREIWAATFAEILSIIGIVAELLVPYLSAMLIDFCIQKSEILPDSGGIFHFLLNGKYGQPQTFRLFMSVAIVYSVLMVLRIGLIYIRDLMQERQGLNLETRLRYATYHKLLSLDSETISEYNSGELLQILNSDTIMYKELFSHRIPYFIDAIVMLVVAILLLFSINYWLIIIPLFTMPFLVINLVNFKKKAKANFKKIRAARSGMNQMVQENIAAVRIVRSFTNETLEKEKFTQSNNDLKDKNVEQIWLSSKFDLTFNTLKQAAYIGTLVIGAVLTMKGLMSVGYILASATYVMRLMGAITGLSNHIFNMQQQMVAGIEMEKFMQAESRVPDEGDEKLVVKHPDIELHNVCVTIDGQEVLKNINLSIPYGKKVGIVGGTGSGKSVLLKTLVRIRDITDGDIIIDQHNIKSYSLENLRDIYAYVFQDVFLFSNTIDSNIAYGKPDAEEENVILSSMRAQAHSFITHLSEQYHTIVGERGLGISGGQKQRVSIARAFLKNSPILVLDDSTSALDVNTERRLLQNIKDSFADKTVIITAHRLSSVVDCDEILYMKDGEIVERGTFDELMAQKGIFAMVYDIQQEQQHAIADFDVNEAGGEING